MSEQPLYLHSEASEITANCIFISGSARSGTTLMGKIIHSFEGVEYSFEPPLLASLLPLIDKMQEYQFRVLFETLVYEDLMMGQITGRAFNFNTNDDSFILRTKSKELIDKRLETIWNKDKAVKFAKKRKLAMKFPDVTPYLSMLQKYYPNIKLVIMLRKANTVLNSVLKKKWLTDENLAQRTLIWPGKSSDGPTIPFWVSDDDIDDWKQMNLYDRAGYYYCQVVEPIFKLKNSMIVIYEDILQKPDEAIKKIAETLNLNYGSKTISLIESVRYPVPPNEDWVGKLSANIKQRLEILSQKVNGGIL